MQEILISEKSFCKRFVTNRIQPITKQLYDRFAAKARSLIYKNIKNRYTLALLYTQYTIRDQKYTNCPKKASKNSTSTLILLTKADSDDKI